MGRIARMPFVYYDKTKRRYFVERRVPEDVQPITGKTKRKHLFPQSIDHATANDLSIGIIQKWDAEWDRVRPQPKRVLWFDPAADVARFEKLAGDSARLAAMVETGEIIIPTKEEYLEIRRQARGWPTVEPPNMVDLTDLMSLARSAAEQPALARAVVNYKDVIEAPDGSGWAKERNVGSKGKAQRYAVMDRFFAWLSAGHTDMALVTEFDLLRYRQHLVSKIGDGYTDRTADKELQAVKAIFRYAHENTRNLTENPAAKIKNLGAKSGTRDGFEDHERALLIREAVKSNSPIVKWANLFGGYLGLRMAEIAEAQTTDFQTFPDGTLVFGIREDEREVGQTLKNEQSRRRLPVPDPLIRAGFRNYLEAVIREHGHGPLFPMLKRDKHGRRNTYASNEVAEWLNGFIPDRRKSHHSWRATVRTMLENAGVSSDRARWIVGHKPRDVDAAHYLKHPVPDLIAAIGKLSDPTMKIGAEAA